MNVNVNVSKQNTSNVKYQKIKHNAMHVYFLEIHPSCVCFVLLLLWITFLKTVLDVFSIIVSQYSANSVMLYRACPLGVSVHHLEDRQGPIQCTDQIISVNQVIRKYWTTKNIYLQHLSRQRAKKKAKLTTKTFSEKFSKKLIRCGGKSQIFQHFQAEKL